jgi:hypothetical protein
MPLLRRLPPHQSVLARYFIQYAVATSAVFFIFQFGPVFAARPARDNVEEELREFRSVVERVLAERGEKLAQHERELEQLRPLIVQMATLNAVTQTVRDLVTAVTIAVSVQLVLAFVRTFNEYNRAKGGFRRRREDHDSRD